MPETSWYPVVLCSIYIYMKGHVRHPLPSYCFAGPGGTSYDTYVTFMYEVGMEGKEVELEGC